MSKLVFRPRHYSEGLKLICEKIKEKEYKAIQCKPNNSKYRTKQRDTEIQWGAGTGDKRVQLRTLSNGNISCVEATENKDVAERWLEEGNKVVCRAVVNGHGGAGITVVSDGELIPNVPLYTKYQKKKREFRVHCILDTVMCLISEKKKMALDRRPENFNKYIRNHDNGWVFCHNTEIDINLRTKLEKIALEAVKSLGIFFGAVDIGWHPDRGCFVFEVNSAPGCDNLTAEWYADQFIKIHKQEV